MKEKEFVYCNVCGRKIYRQGGVFKEDFLTICKNWGYFSQKDGKKHEILICESCYDQWVDTFAISPVISDTVEMI